MSYTNYSSSGHYDRNKKMKNKQSNNMIRHNYDIRSSYCRIIENGKALDIMKTLEAIAYAENLDQDLIEIGYDKANNCSNCKLGDYSKYMYELKKKEKNAKKMARANASDIKTIQLSLTIDVADKERMIEHAKEFLNDGDKVKLSLRFRNRRELESINLAKDLMKEVLNHFNGIAILDSNPVLSGREMSCILRKA